MTKVFYVAHPVTPLMAAPGLAEYEFGIADNLARARRWLRWLIDREPDVAFCMSWLAYVEVLDNAAPEMYERSLRDDCEIATRCDGIVLVGGRLGKGMVRERDAVIVNSGTVVDYLFLGDEPPAVPPTFSACEAECRALEPGSSNKYDGRIAKIADVVARNASARNS